MAGTRDPVDRMAPWDAAPYFQTPKESLVSLPGNAPTPVCAADPNRVALVFNSAGLGAANFSTNPGVGTTQGVSTGGTLAPVKLLFCEVGPLVQMAWYANSTQATSVTVFEVTLAKWPAVKIPGKGAQRADAARATKRNRNGR